MMSSQKLLISGNWENAGEMTFGLLQAGFRLELLVSVRSNQDDIRPHNSLRKTDQQSRQQGIAHKVKL
jgi:hypothetical protein